MRLAVITKIFAFANVATAFQVIPTVSFPKRIFSTAVTTLKATEESSADAGNSVNAENDQEGDKSSDVEAFLKTNYPAFHALLSMDEDVIKVAHDTSSSGCTFFAPTDKAFEDLGEKKRLQLEDPRNLETAKKLAAFHVISTDAVKSAKLKTEDWRGGRPKDGPPKLVVGGLMTMGGEVNVGRKKVGGFLGIGATEDWDIVIGPEALIVQSFDVGNCVVHEVDSLISPQFLWRYFDQLRIPGF